MRTLGNEAGLDKYTGTLLLERFRPQILLFRGDFFFLFLNAKKIKLLGATAPRNSGPVNFKDLNFRGDSYPSRTCL